MSHFFAIDCKTFTGCTVHYDKIKKKFSNVIVLSKQLLFWNNLVFLERDLS